MTVEAIVFDAYGTLYDVQSVSSAVATAFPNHSEAITQIWRLKQLEYSWLRSMMGRFKDFRTVSRESLHYTLQVFGLSADAPLMDRLLDAYDDLSPYPEAIETLDALKGHRLAILSNGSQNMLDALVRNSGMDRHLNAVISVDPKQVFKPDPRAYELVEERLGVQPKNVVFVTSNGFDVAGAASFGFQVVRIERVTPAALRDEVAAAPIGAASMFKALRTQLESLEFGPRATVDSLLALPALVQGWAVA